MKRIVLAITAALSIGDAIAQTAYPTRPIRLIVPFPPGGNIDITARAIAPGLSEIFGQQIVIDNRGGAGGLIGTDLAAKAAPDGYTLVIGSSGTLTVAPSLYSKMPYDAMKDFASIALLSYAPIVLVVSPSLPAKTLKDFIALGKTRMGKMSMSSSGNGTTNQLAGELFQIETGTKFVHVPYKGSGPALIDVMGGQVDMLFDQISSSAPYVKGGKLRALATANDKRSSVLPEVPTMAESGVKNCEAGTTTALMGPAGMARDIITKLNSATNKALATNATRDRFHALGTEVLGGSAAENDARIKAEFVKWHKVAKAANIKLE